MASKFQEVCYKILTRWYRVPSELQKMDAETADRCWRCGTEGGMMIHIFWACPLL